MTAHPNDRHEPAIRGRMMQGVFPKRQGKDTTPLDPDPDLLLENPLTVELRGLLRDVVVAADRMRDDWAESDKAVRRRLWANLHTAVEAAYEAVYPL